MKVAFLNPATNSDPFFGNMVAFMRVAAGALDIDLEVIECDHVEAKMREHGRALARRGQRPDCLLLNNDLNVGLEILPRAAEAGIKVLLICQGTMAADAAQLGEPREKYADWLGELLPDDRESGFVLASTLIEQARAAGKTASDGKIHMCGLSGTFTSASILRVGGLRDAAAENPDVSLEEVAPATWQRDKAAWWASELLKRNPLTSVIWGANDSLALGAADAISAAGKVPGKDVFTGGIDWAPLALPKVRDGVLAASLGGHFMDGAWGLIMLYDHCHGYDFDAIRSRTHNVLVTSANVHEYLGVLDRSRWSRIDFTAFSKARNSALEHYDFSPEQVVRQLEEVAPRSRAAVSSRVVELPTSQRTSFVDPGLSRTA